MSNKICASCVNWTNSCGALGICSKLNTQKYFEDTCASHVEILDGPIEFRKCRTCVHYNLLTPIELLWENGNKKEEVGYCSFKQQRVLENNWCSRFLAKTSRQVSMPAKVIEVKAPPVEIKHHIVNTPETSLMEVD